MDGAVGSKPCGPWSLGLFDILDRILLLVERFSIAGAARLDNFSCNFDRRLDVILQRMNGALQCWGCSWLKPCYPLNSFRFFCDDLRVGQLCMAKPLLCIPVAQLVASTEASSGNQQSFFLLVRGNLQVTLCPVGTAGAHYV